MTNARQPQAPPHTTPGQGCLPPAVALAGAAWVAKPLAAAPSRAAPQPFAPTRAAGPPATSLVPPPPLGGLGGWGRLGGRACSKADGQGSSESSQRRLVAGRRTSGARHEQWK